ncbi:MAG: O-antigen ligase family protein, partial [Kiritimatiellales bacterium]
MSFKYIVFYAVFLLGIPAAVLAGLVFRPFKNFLVALMCFSLCYPESMSINFVSRESYRMATRGFELGLFDVCTIALFFILVFQTGDRRFRWFPPLTITYGLYIIAGIISWMLTSGNIPIPSNVQNVYASAGYDFYSYFETGLYPLFELSKILRGGLTYLVVVNFLHNEKDFQVLLSSLIIVVVVLTVESLIDRYIWGYHRISATLGHPNSLGTFTSMTGTLMFGVALFRTTFLSSGTFAIATAASLVCVLLTISRGALSAMVLGLWLDVSSLFHRYLNFKNFTILFLGSLVVLGLFFMAADTITARFLTQQDAVSDIEYRGLYNEEAKGMARDHAFGVGLGNFSAYSWLKYAAEAGLNEPGTPAHNLWFLTLGEVGYPGLIAFVIYWFRFYSIGLPFLFRQRKDHIYSVA